MKQMNNLNADYRIKRKLSNKLGAMAIRIYTGTLRVILNINTFMNGILFATYIPIQGYLGTLLVTIRLSKYR